MVTRVVDVHGHAAHRVARFSTGRYRLETAECAGRAPRDEVREHGHRDLGVGDRAEIETRGRMDAGDVRIADAAITQVLEQRGRALRRRDDTDVRGIGRERELERKVVVVPLRRDDDGARRDRCAAP